MRIVILPKLTKEKLHKIQNNLFDDSLLLALRQLVTFSDVKGQMPGSKPRQPMDQCAVAIVGK